MIPPSSDFLLNPLTRTPVPHARPPACDRNLRIRDISSETTTKLEKSHAQERGLGCALRNWIRVRFRRRHRNSRRPCRPRRERQNGVQPQRLQPAQRNAGGRRPRPVEVHTPNEQAAAVSRITMAPGEARQAQHLSVAVDASQDDASSAFKLAKQYLGQLPNAKKVSGVGSLAWESSQGTVTTLNFVVGHDICHLGPDRRQALKVALAGDRARRRRSPRSSR